MNKSESIKSLAMALAKFQEEIKNPGNTANNPFFNSKYAPLSDILNLVRPIMSKHGLSHIQTPGGDGDRVTVTTLLMHASGEWIESDPCSVKVDKVTAQGAGSAITYARRYSLSAILGISSEDDDDGNHVSQPQNKPQNKQTTSAKVNTPKENKTAPQGNSESLDKNKIDALRSGLQSISVTEDYICKFYKLNSLDEIDYNKWLKAMEWVANKKAKVEGQ